MVGVQSEVQPVVGEGKRPGNLARGLSRVGVRRRAARIPGGEVQHAAQGIVEVDVLLGVDVGHQRIQRAHALVAHLGFDQAARRARQRAGELAVDRARERRNGGLAIAQHQRQGSRVGQPARMRLGCDAVKQRRGVRHEERRGIGADCELARAADPDSARIDDLHLPRVAARRQHFVPVDPVLGRCERLGVAVRIGQGNLVHAIGTDVGPAEVRRALLDRCALGRPDRRCELVARRHPVCRRARHAGLGLGRERQTRR